MTKYISRAAIAAAALTLGVSGANALQANGNLSVSATVVTACSVTGGTLAFGNIATGTITPTSGTSTGVSVTCPTPYTVTLGQGGHWDSTNSKFQVADTNGNLIGYQLSDIGGGNTTWSNPSFPGSATPTSLPIYGTLDGLTNGQPAGSYTDVVQIQVIY